MIVKTPETPAVLAVASTLAVFVIVVLIWMHPVPADSKDLFTVMATGVLSTWTGIAGYYFGSSKNTQHQSELLANSIPISSAPIEIQKKQEN